MWDGANLAVDYLLSFFLSNARFSKDYKAKFSDSLFRFDRSGEACRKGVRRCFEKETAIQKCPLPQISFAIIVFCTMVLFCKERIKTVLGMVILAYLFDCIIKSPIILAEGQTLFSDVIDIRELQDNVKICEKLCGIVNSNL